MSDINKFLTRQQVETITTSSYYHMKHYGDLKHLDVSYYQQKMEYAKDEGRQYLFDLIKKQKQKEENKLTGLFSANLDNQLLKEIGYSQNQIKKLVEVYNTAKKGGIEEKLEFLNLFTSLSLYIPDEDADPLGQVQRVIDECFYSSGTTNFAFKGGMEDYEIFVSGLVGIFNSLMSYANRHKGDGIIEPMVNTVLKKLKYLITYYQKDYEAKAKDRGQAAKELQKLFTNTQFQQFVDVKAGRKWSKLTQAKGNFDLVKSVLQDSASGFLQQRGGKDYEESVVISLADDLSKLLASQSYSSEIKKSVTGLDKDLKGKYQKADIKLDISISGTTFVSESDFSLTFSVKKSSDSTSSIQIHHGGSLFSYAERLSDKGLGLDFLNDGSFQYVFVNEFQRRRGGNTDFIKAIRSVLQSFGFYFLGQEIEEGDGGADFLYVAGKIYSFSSVLEKALTVPEIFETVLRFSNKEPLKEKALLMKQMDQKGAPFYSNDFIQGSIAIGKNSIYGTAFTIKLKKSALNL